MNANKTLKLILASMVTLGIGATVAFLGTPSAFRLTNGASTTYQLKMTSEKNRVNTSSQSKGDVVDLLTEEGHEVEFEYNNLKGSDSGWQTMTDNYSYIMNSTAINGLTSISFGIIDDGDFNFLIKCSDTADFAKSSSMSISLWTLFGTKSATWDFDKKSPAYVQLLSENNQPVTIDFITLEYTCIAK